MNKNRLILSIFLVTLCGCHKEDLSNSDDYVGTYNVSVINRTRIGTESLSDSSTGVFSIYKISSKRVQVVGYIETYGEIQNNKVYFEPMSYSNNGTEMETSFEPAQLNGKILIFRTITSGHYIYNGKSYPYSCESNWTAIRQDEE